MVIVLVLILFFTSSVSSIGLSPPQLRVVGAPMIANSKAATLLLRNTDNEPAYLLMQITCLASSRPHKLRVVCNGCSRQTGIQRGDLMNGTCPFCSSDNLLFYDFPPAFVLDGISLVCEKSPLEKTGDRTYKTVDKVASQDTIEINIYLDLSSEEINMSILNTILRGATAPLNVEDVGRILDGRANASVYVDYIERRYGQHWEARITVTSVSNLSQGEGASLVYGAESKFLIDTVALSLKKEEMKIDDQPSLWLFIIIAVGGATIVGFIVIIVKARKKEVDIKFPASKRRQPLARIIKGRKLL